MNLEVFQALLPLILPSFTAILVLLAGGLKAPRRLIILISLLGLLGGFFSLIRLDTEIPWIIHHFLTIDRFGLFIMELLYGVAFFVGVLQGFSADDDKHSDVFYGILLLSLTGMGVLVWTQNLAAFFLGLEIYTAGLYILIAYRRERSISLEAAVKYLIMAGISSGFILLGIALLYLDFGTLELNKIAVILKETGGSRGMALWWLGSILLFVGVCFKLSLVPFHMWAPDVYQGAPTMVAALIATASKTAILSLVIRFMVLFTPVTQFNQVLQITVIASLIIGNLLALYQQNLKRLLAYSSIAHIGYAAVPLCIGGVDAWPASLLYLITYIVTSLAAFAFIVAEEGDGPEVGALKHYNGLGHARPFQAAGMAMTFFSLAGIPITAGFIGKWSVFKVALVGGSPVLIGAFIFGASLGAFYYLRVIAALYFSGEDRPISPQRQTRGLIGALVVIVFAIVAIGLYPEPLLKRIDQATQQFTPNFILSSTPATRP